MKRVLTIVSLLSLAVAPGAVASGAMAHPPYHYGWSLSGSSTDPNVNTAPATALGEPFQVYLWLSCTPTPNRGLIAVEFSLQSSFFNAGFTTMGGALNAGDSVDLLLAVGGCPVAPFLIGAWTFQDLSGLGGNACLGLSPGGTNGTVDCDTVCFGIHANAVEGFTTDGSNPCAVGTCESPVSVEDASWGSIKGLHR